MLLWSQTKFLCYILKMQSHTVNGHRHCQRIKKGWFWNSLGWKMFNVEFVTFFPLLFTQSLLHSFMCMHAYFHYTLVTSSAEDKENQHNIFPRVSDTWNNFVCRSHLIWVEVVYLSGQPWWKKFWLCQYKLSPKTDN